MRKIKYKVLVEELSTIKPEIRFCKLPDGWCYWWFREVGPV